MTPSELEKFINGGETIVYYTYPTVGAVLSVRGVLDVRLRGKHIALALSPSDPDETFLTRVTFIRDIMPISDTVVFVRIDDAFPPQALKFQRLTDSKADAPTRAQWSEQIRAYDEDDAVPEMERLLAEATPPLEPELTTEIVYMVWLRYDAPQGVLYLENGTMRDFLFPTNGSGYGLQDGRFVGITEEQFINDVPERMGRAIGVERARKIKGSDINDAVSRAMFKYGQAHYERTGRSLY